MSNAASARGRARKQTENEVEDAVVTWLRIEGWIVRRQHVGTYYTKDGRLQAIGEVGECDWRAMRPGERGKADYLEFVAKATGKKPSDAQREYMAKRKRQGVLCIWADSIDSFLDQYEAAYANPA
jgi:hypothetical protein